MMDEGRPERDTRLFRELLKGDASDCPEEAEIGRYEAGNLTIEREREIERHVAGCGVCLDFTIWLAENRAHQKSPAGQREAEEAEAYWSSSAEGRQMVEGLAAAVLGRTVREPVAPTSAARTILSQVATAITRRLGEWLSASPLVSSYAFEGGAHFAEKRTERLWALRRWPLELRLVRLPDASLRLYVQTEEPGLEKTRVLVRLAQETFEGILEPKPGGRVGAAIDLRVFSKLGPEDVEVTLTPRSSEE